MNTYPKYNDIMGTGSGNTTYRRVVPEPVPESESESEHIPEPLEILNDEVKMEHLLQLAGSPHFNVPLHPVKWNTAHGEFSLRRNKPEYMEHVLNNTIDQQINDRVNNRITHLDPQHTMFIYRILGQNPMPP